MLKNKFQAAIYYKEYAYVLHGLLKRLRLYRNKSYKIRRAIIIRNLHKELNKHLIKEKFRGLILFGNYESNNCTPKLRNYILTSANKILQGRLSILGCEIEMDKTWDWHKDYRSGFRWPKGTFYLNYKQVDLNNEADVKVPRELSRSHYMLIVSQAFLLTQDEKYANFVFNLMNQWIDDNPLMYSINWGCTMDVAIRGANWVMALALLQNSKNFSQNINKILFSLYEHGWFISKNLEESYKLDANHFDGDIGGLLFLGVLFKNTQRGEKWFKYSKYALFDAIRTQILPSGMELEKSVFYHRLVLEIFSYNMFLLKKIDEKIPADIEYRIWKAFSFIDDICLPDGQLPILGDQDSARFLPFDKIYRNDIDYLRSLAVTYYEDESFLTNNLAPTSEVSFFLNSGKTIRYSNIFHRTRSEAKAFIDVGIIKISNPFLFLIINNSSPGRYVDDPFLGGSHAHADLLSFVLSYKSIPIFIDPGTYLYTANPKKRNLYRSTKMHNTVEINGHSQFSTDNSKLFDYNSKAEVENILFTNKENKIAYEGLHTAYEYLNNDIIHKRRFELMKDLNTLTICDIIKGNNISSCIAYFHLAPHLITKVSKNKVSIYDEDKIICDICFKTKKNLIISIKQSEASSSYGTKQSNKVILVDFTNNSDLTLITELHFM